ncbi:hypothetical protein DDE82_001822 [Stemphylium lycopersici]|nr:hypothetical protein DDE82_001822 [Stemphylium lycopersici]
MAGSTYDVVVLSSSPPAASPQHDAPSRRVAMPASSPLAFSPPVSPLRTTTGASRINPRAASIPEGAVRGFATVGSLLRSEHFTSRLDDDFTEIQQAQQQREPKDVAAPMPAAAKPKNRSTKKPGAAADGPEKPKPKPRARKPKPKSDKEIVDSDEELRRPPRPTKSPFFDEQAPEPPVEPPIEAADLPKLTKSGKPRKPRAKKQKAEEEGVEPVPKAKRTRVTKTKTAAVKNCKGQPENASVMSSHFRGGADGAEDSTVQILGTESINTEDTDGQAASIQNVPEGPQSKKPAAPKQRAPDPVAGSLDLEEAVLRRRDWTPPLDTAIHSPYTDSTGKENRSLGQDTEGSFTNLISNFTYAQSPSAQATAKVTSSTSEVMAATKRRRIELVEIPSNQAHSRDSSPEKGKAPKKKPRTITDLVTGQYGPRDDEVDPNTVTSNFFEPRTSTTTVPLNDTPAPDSNAPPKKPPRKRNSSKAKADKTDKAEPKAKSKKGSAKAAKPKPVAEKLLSPGEAKLRLNQQDVLFGTSSQLALEESPTVIRQIQVAMKESEQDANHMDSFSLDPPPKWPRLGKMQGNRGLWAASARDDEGGMLEHMQDVYIPEPDRTLDIPLLMDSTLEKSDAITTELDDSSTFIDIDDIPPDPPPVVHVSSDLPTPPRPKQKGSQTMQSSKQGYPMTDVEFEDIDNFDLEPPPSNQNADSQLGFADIDDFDFPPSAQMRNSPVSTFKLPASAAKTGDGSPKKRGRPLKSQSAIPNIAASSTPTLKPSSGSKVKPRKKDPTPSTPPTDSGRFIDIEEILDSEDDALETFSPTPPRVCKHIDSGPLPLVALSPPTSPSKPKKSAQPKPTAKPPADASLTRIHRIPTAHLEWVNIKPDIFAQITMHIRSLPPTTDPAKPSWHEKILIYDPIVLEEFTSYLNTNTPIRVYRKATQKQVKAWNQQRRVNGEPDLVVEKGEGGKGDGEDVLAVERELETTMVQSWSRYFTENDSEASKLHTPRLLTYYPFTLKQSTPIFKGRFPLLNFPAPPPQQN